MCAAAREPCAAATTRVATSVQQLPRLGPPRVMEFGLSPADDAAPDLPASHAEPEPVAGVIDRVQAAARWKRQRTLENKAARRIAHKTHALRQALDSLPEDGYSPELALFWSFGSVFTYLFADFLYFGWLLRNCFELCIHLIRAHC